MKKPEYIFHSERGCVAALSHTVQPNEFSKTISDDQMVGESAKLLAVQQQVRIVAETDSTVLLLGETGTGKGMLASMIHEMSARRDERFVKVNCAAIPLGLLESELFGHERGSFTGALTQRIGRFEAANRGTLFLDEVGDIPQELQPKLLRVLQDHEFERLGSTQTIHINVRLIAATHRNQARKKEESKIRADLYYRLNVFPIAVPPLRERQQDIPLLVRYFARVFSQRMRREIDVIPDNTIQCLIRHPWPGNIRELENFIARSVILSRGPVLEAPLKDLAPSTQQEANAVTLKDVERAHIRSILHETNGNIGAAAVRLGVPRSTLFYKLRRLDISVPRETKRPNEPLAPKSRPETG